MLKIESYKTRIIQYTKNVMFNVVLFQYQKWWHNRPDFYIRLYILGKFKTEKKVKNYLYNCIYLYIYFFIKCIIVNWATECSRAVYNRFTLGVHNTLKITFKVTKVIFEVLLNITISPKVKLKLCDWMKL